MAEDQDQDKLAEEWAKALAQENEDAGQDEAALAEAWSAALKEEQSGDSDQALADEWAKALADEEETKIKKEHKKKQLAAQSRNFEYQDLTAEAKSPRLEAYAGSDFILDIPLDVSAQLGSTRLLINDLLQLGQGSVIELDKLAGEPLEILVTASWWRAAKP